MVINEYKRMVEAGEIDSPSGAKDDKFPPKRKECLTLYDRTLLYDAPLRRGSRVTLRKCLPPIYTVIKIVGDKALCMPKGGTEAVEFDLSELIGI